MAKSQELGLYDALALWLKNPSIKLIPVEVEEYEEEIADAYLNIELLRARLAECEDELVAMRVKYEIECQFSMRYRDLLREHGIKVN